LHYLNLTIPVPDLRIALRLIKKTIKITGLTPSLVSAVPTVTLANQHSFTTTAGQSILDAGVAAGVVLDHSCRDGRCGQCRTTVVHGATKPLRPELVADLNPGEILTCVREAVSDVVLNCEDLGALAHIQSVVLPARIDVIETVSNDIRVITLRTPPSDPLTFLPGQYVELVVKGVERSYSLANAPRADGKLRLVIRRYPGGRLSQYWFDDAKVNDLVRIKGPRGTFILKEPLASHTVLVATGTGIAPIWALLEQTTLRQADHVTVIWGNRRPEDFFGAFCADITRLVPHARFFKALSAPTEGFEGSFGYVQDVLKAQFTDLSQVSIYACGLDRMIYDLKSTALGLGLNPSRFYSDAFLPAPTTQQ